MDTVKNRVLPSVHGGPGIDVTVPFKYNFFRSPVIYATVVHVFL